MFKIFLTVLVLFGVSLAHAEEKTCVVRGMHCDDCASSVTTKVCVKGKYATCDAKIVNKKEEIGQIHIVTKNVADKIDEKILSEEIKDVGYTLDKCVAAKAKKS